MGRIALVFLACLALGACAMPVNAPAPIPSPHIDWRG
jgi:acyl-CoA synthetase (AMP-forming)/AMP-acid ligase II